jgi:hypothetical protein
VSAGVGRAQPTFLRPALLAEVSFAVSPYN